MKKLGEGSTSGPWHGKYSHGYVDIPICDEQGRFVARVSAGGVFRDGEGFSNARLIAKAPLLIEAREVLEQAVLRIELANKEGDSILSAWLPETRALLAKLR